ncbi:hypothetical protein [Neobacillus sp. 204]|uniref:hypothetical protein n=1 Tax=Neobacillus sp. 204 TaxID=3383351 RepID=UPI0039785B81
MRGRIQGSQFNVLREYGAGETPQALKAPRRLPATPANRSRLKRKSTDKFNTVFLINVPLTNLLLKKVKLVQKTVIILHVARTVKI